MAKLELRRDAAARTVEAQVGDILTLRLPENPSTGYRWEVEVGSVVEVVSDSFALEGDGIGAGGEREFVFCIRQPGSDIIKMMLRRSWESETAAIDRIAFSVRAR